MLLDDKNAVIYGEGGKMGGAVALTFGAKVFTPQSKRSRGSRSVCSPPSKPLHRLRTGRKRQPRRKRAQPYDSAGDDATRRFPSLGQYAAAEAGRRPRRAPRSGAGSAA